MPEKLPLSPALAPEDPPPAQGGDPLAHALRWDWGTAYELLLSVNTIFHPKRHGVPAPWAAGVRKRLSAQTQVELKSFYDPAFSLPAYMPMHLVYEMDAPKDAARFLDYVEAIPGEEFTRRAYVPLLGSSHLLPIVRKALSGQMPSSSEIEEYRKTVGRERILPAPLASDVRRLFTELAEPAATKARWLAALREYHSVFFVEEEARLGPVLKAMLEQAQSISHTMKVSDLIEKLSNGFTISEESNLRKLVLVPSVWLQPFALPVNLSEDALLVVWGAHPPGYRLVPGEIVPDEAVLVLRALGDPTRLRLLRLLSAEPRSPQALANELKLSLPTVSHHMRELRLAGLVRLETRVSAKGRDSKYTVRWQSAERAFKELGHFVTPAGAGENGV